MCVYVCIYVYVCVCVGYGDIAVPFFNPRRKRVRTLSRKPLSFTPQGIASGLNHSEGLPKPR